MSDWTRSAPGAAYEEQIRRSYVSVDRPNFRFVLDTQRQNPYRVVVDDLSAVADLVDDTDTNCEVCFTYLVNAGFPMLVRLSMVGPYAVVLSAGPTADDAPCSLLKDDQPLGSVAARIISILDGQGVLRVPQEHLEAPVRIALVDGQAEVSLYAALFEPEAELPWRLELGRARWQAPDA